MAYWVSKQEWKNERTREVGKLTCDQNNQAIVQTLYIVQGIIKI